MAGASPVSIIIPHVRGREILFRCLNSLRAATLEAGSESQPQEIVVVDNGSTDGSVASAQQTFPEIAVLRVEENIGFAGACNLGIRKTRGEFIVLLNDDAEVTPRWLNPLFECLRDNEQVAACQPKLVSLLQPAQFDYAGAGGGQLDVLGYPFTRGRIFQSIENDVGQYDDAQDVFWASGACMMLRRSALDAVGPLDDDFFAHMEEIDLCWRFHLAGYRVRVVSASVVLHQSGSTLREHSPEKIYLNHRNSLMMLLKNYSWSSMVWIFPLRLLLEMIAVFTYVAWSNVRGAWAVLRGFVDFVLRIPATLRKRRDVQHVRRRSDSVLRSLFYQRSIVIDYFLLQRRSYPELVGSRDEK
jgi:hypothetical protein